MGFPPIHDVLVIIIYHYNTSPDFYEMIFSFFRYYTPGECAFCDFEKDGQIGRLS